MENQNQNPTQPNSEIKTPHSPQGDALQNQKTNILKSKFFLGFVALSVLISFLVGGFALGKNSTSKQSPAPTNTQSQTASPTPNLTADWKTYTGNSYSFKYPASWEIAIIPTTQNIAILTDKIAKNIQKEPGTCASYYPITINDETGLITSNRFDNTNSQTVTQKPTVISGLAATEYSMAENLMPPCDWQSGKWEAITVNNNGKKYLISLNPSDKSNYKEIFDLLISTFKFTDSTSSTDTSNWKTYTNNKYFYSVKYPAGLEPKGESSVGPYSTAFEEIQSEPGAPTLPKFYVSVIPDGFWQNGAIYNYPRADFLTNLESIQVGQSKSVIPNLDQNNTFTRLPDITVDGKTAMFFENSSPWEAKSDERMLVKKTGYTYMIGAYNQKGLSEELKIFLSTFKFTQ